MYPLQYQAQRNVIRAGVIAHSYSTSDLEDIVIDALNYIEEYHLQIASLLGDIASLPGTITDQD